MTVFDDGFPAGAGSSVENFPVFIPSENLRVAMPVKTWLCLARYPVSNDGHEQVPREEEEESKGVWCFPGMLPCLQLSRAIRIAQ